MPIATKHGRAVNYHDGLTPIKSHDPLITWFWEITQKIFKYYVFTTKVTVATKLFRMMD